ncbi:MAG: hypothetical protein KAU14_03635, partial [Thermoplasmata archaeon]|nr:hypothetical protein [Thermoplasmata archaeon]
MSCDEGIEHSFGEYTTVIVEEEPPVNRTINITIEEIEEEIKPGNEINVTGTVTLEPEGEVQEIKILLDGAEVATATLDGNNYASAFTLPTGLTEGNHTITVNVTLKTGESAEKSTEINYTKEEPVQHTITITIDETQEEIRPGNTINVTGTITVEPSVPIQGVRILLDGGEAAAATMNGGQFSAALALPTGLSEGNHTITVNVTLETGESTEKSTTILYEKEIPPVVRNITLTIDKITDEIEPERNITVSGSIIVEPDGEVKVVRIFLDGAEAVTAELNGTNFSGIVALPADLSEGNHTIIVNVTLQTGESAERSTMITCTKEEPVQHTITITIDKISEKIEPGKEITVSGTIDVEPSAAIRDVRIFLDTTMISTAELEGNRFSCKITLPADLTEGNHTITVNVTLQTAESTEKSTTINYEKETIEPQGEDEDEGISTILLVGVGIILLVVLLGVLVKLGVLPSGGKKGDKGDWIDSPGKESVPESKGSGLEFDESVPDDEGSGVEPEGKQEMKEMPLKKDDKPAGEQEVWDSGNMKKDNDTGDRKDNREDRESRDTTI